MIGMFTMDMQEMTLLYLAHINDGFLSIVDISDKSNPLLLGTQDTPNTFSHNIWLSDNGEVVFTTDELSGSYVASFDITDPTNISQLDKIQSSPGQGVIPHNTFVYNDYLVTSYYSDGITIHDATYPYNLVEVGNYDTYPQQTTSYDGCWGIPILSIWFNISYGYGRRFIYPKSNLSKSKLS